MRRSNADLQIAAALAVLGAFVVVFVPNTPVQVIFALPLLFVLPGLALSAALFPSDRRDLARRLVTLLGLSLAVAILGALLLDLLPFGLRSSSWAILLALVTCGSVAVAIRRRSGGRSGTFFAPRVRLVDVVLFGFALALVAGTLIFARTPLAAKNVQGYTALSMLPGQGSKSRVLQVQISSSELRPLRYRLELHVGRNLFAVRHVALAPGQSWRATWRLTPNEIAGVRRIRARLYRADHPHAIYRSVWLTEASP